MPKERAQNSTQNNANTIIERQLNHQLCALESVLNADTLVFRGPIASGCDEIIRDLLESLRGKRKTRGKKLVVILQTGGGSIETVERIVSIFRQHYTQVEFIIPNRAMSAGTVLVLSGDEIHMDYFSTLGPIDPQIQNKEGVWVPALGYLEEHDRLLKKAEKQRLTPEETAYFLNKFDPAELYRYKQARELSKQLLEDWLVKYKFRNWTTTKNRKIKVTPAIKRETAQKIADQLNATAKWCSHDRGISRAVLQKKLSLNIRDFAQNRLLNDQIRTYEQLLNDYTLKRRRPIVFHTREHYVSI